MKRLPLRKLVQPPRWAVVWFPALPGELLATLTSLRKRHDPLAELPAPHLSLVFPFSAHVTLTQLRAHVKKASAGFPQVPVVLRGTREVKAEFIFLDARIGAKAIRELHDRLYTGIVAPFLRDDIPYDPHITLGRNIDDALRAQALADAEDGLPGEYRAVMRELSILRIGREIEVAATVPLGQ